MNHASAAAAQPPISGLPQALLLACALCLSLAAQDAGAEERKIPRPPSTGLTDKVAAPQAAKNGVPPEPVLTPPPRRDPSRPLATEPQRVAAAVERIVAKQFADPDFVSIDEPPDGGPITVASGQYKARFAADGWDFVGRPNADARDLVPIHFHLDQVRVGEATLPMAAVAPQRSGQRITFEHAAAALLEALDVRGNGVEQSFTFTGLPTRAAITIDLGVTTALHGEDTADGIVFADADHRVGYSRATAIDARGERIAVPTHVVDGHLRIEVPGSFVATAVLPLVVDPVVTAIGVYITSSAAVRSADVAWDETSQRWAVVFEYIDNLVYADCYARLLDGNLNPIGNLITIENWIDNWSSPRIANLGFYGRFLVVCEVDSTSGGKVSARMFDNQGVLTTAQFDIANDPVGNILPDVGGDPSTVPPTYFTVVYEHAFSTTDHDIYARQVDANGNLRGTAPIVVQADTNFQTNPTISKSDGGGVFSSQRFAIVYEQVYTNTDHDIYGSLLTWDGSFVPVAGQNTFVIDYSPALDSWPQISSPTLPDASGNRQLLAVYMQPIPFSAPYDSSIQATGIDAAGTVLATGNIRALENDPVRHTWAQEFPCVDTDGARFAVGYRERYTNSADWDIRLSLVGMYAGSLHMQEAGVLVAGSNDPEYEPQISSRYSGAGTFSSHFCTVDTIDDPNFFAIDALAYDGYGHGGFTIRPTACGSLTVAVNGSSQLGGSFSLSLNTGNPLSGFVAGTPMSAGIAPCSGCVLGVNGVILVGQPYGLTIPARADLAGLVFSFQGWSWSGGNCLGTISLSDTVDLTIQ